MAWIQIFAVCALAVWPWVKVMTHPWIIKWQQLCEILSRSHVTVRSYDKGLDFCYVCTVTLTLAIWPWVKVMTHPLVMNNSYVKCYQDPTWQKGVMTWTRVLVSCALWPWTWRYNLGQGHDTLLGYGQPLCIHVKLEKFKRGRSPSLHLAKEGDFVRNHFATLILSINIQIPAEILKMTRYFLLIMAKNSSYDA